MLPGSASRARRIDGRGCMWIGVDMGTDRRPVPIRPASLRWLRPMNSEATLGSHSRRGEPRPGGRSPTGSRGWRSVGVAMHPETRYARSGDIGIAYQVLGEGDMDLVVAFPFLSHLD